MDDARIRKGPAPSPARAPRQGPAVGSPVVDRALMLLEVLAESDGLTLSELGRRLGLAPSTVHRLLSALAARRLAEADPATQIWTVGPGAFRLGAAFLRRGGLAERARPVLARLAQDSGETAVLAVPDGDSALVVAEAPGGATLRAVLPPGTRLPYHASAPGKALIAHLPLARVRALLGRAALPALTPRSLTDQGELTADLATLRHGGWLTERGEATLGQNGIAAPVFGGAGEPVAALGLVGPSARLDDAALAALGRRVAEAAAALGAALGGPSGHLPPAPRRG
ncbi:MULTISPECIES: IclR family transcriptional regulator [unclassified Paracoccus (in: a-proteobacteria)]|uniref:IclR family transcriptional regulator n=1 Tax=unclassified Paracoccus (in: a-proteobacteria) TaxID=2688777 RepID=UPI0016007139|nr:MULTISPECIES: IclR family transcriptional regulator [unclassified Paracoccus (in: a-proteobacteria)]MBB1491166.1 IclR family transcriptional regulator [Paracoccus sp. MC1854]MBB1497019.1 IclR family transcriptional regulator [Paracoccus sp. MC1862]QQO44575.1 IclR family transcriptional regulator [Paracoccus sp. MC1862]